MNTFLTTPVTPTFTSCSDGARSSGRQQLYQDHQWMRDFGESLLVDPLRH
ncbi:hypothetical protein ACLK19_08350 [Escherichia coli]